MCLLQNILQNYLLQSTITCIQLVSSRTHRLDYIALVTCPLLKNSMQRATCCQITVHFPSASVSLSWESCAWVWRQCGVRVSSVSPLCCGDTEAAHTSVETGRVVSVMEVDRRQICSLSLCTPFSLYFQQHHHFPSLPTNDSNAHRHSGPLTFTPADVCTSIHNAPLSEALLSNQSRLL